MDWSTSRSPYLMKSRWSKKSHNKVKSSTTFLSISLPKVWREFSVKLVQSGWSFAKIKWIAFTVVLLVNQIFSARKKNSIEKRKSSSMYSYKGKSTLLTSSEWGMNTWLFFMLIRFHFTLWKRVYKTFSSCFLTLKM